MQHEVYEAKLRRRASSMCLAGGKMLSIYIFTPPLRAFSPLSYLFLLRICSLNGAISAQLDDHLPSKSSIRFHAGNYRLGFCSSKARLGFRSVEPKFHWTLRKMESESWSRYLSATSKRHQTSQQSRYDLFLDFEEADVGRGNCEFRAEFACPFCSDDFDIVGLCCHIDEEHPVEANNMVCPICAAKVEMDLIGHVTMQHGHLFKMQRRRRFRRGSSGSHSTLSLLRKELREENLQALFGGSSHPTNPPSAAPDPLLLPLIYMSPVADFSKDIQPECSDKGNLASQSSEEAVNESSKPCLSDKEQVERSRRSEFVQGLVLSTIFEEIS